MRKPPSPESIAYLALLGQGDPHNGELVVDLSDRMFPIPSPSAQEGCKDLGLIDCPFNDKGEEITSRDKLTSLGERMLASEAPDAILKLEAELAQVKAANNRGTNEAKAASKSKNAARVSQIERALEILRDCEAQIGDVEDEDEA